MPANGNVLIFLIGGDNGRLLNHPSYKKQRMKILYSVESIDVDTGGVARAVVCLANALSRLNVTVGLFTVKEAKYLGDIQIDRDVVLYNGDLDESVKHFGMPDLIHDNGLWLPIHGEVAKLAKKHGIPRISSPHGMLEPWALNHNKWKKRLAWWLYQRRNLQNATALHATAESEADQFRNLGLISPSYTIPNGVDLPEACFLESLKENNRTEKTVLFLSRIHPKKGLLLWLDVWKRVDPIGWKMRVVGPNEDGHREEVENMVIESGLENSWTFEGPLEGKEKWHAYVNADLFVLPTHSENFGIVIAEALASGTPVITTTGAPWQGLLEYECGWWCAPTREGLQRAFVNAISSEYKLDKMGNRGRDWMQRDFSWDVISKRMERFYEDLLAKKEDD